MVEITNSFELDYLPIDNDHKVLVEMLNELLELIDHHNCRDCDTKVPEFIDFAKKHFVREEAILKKIGYPEAENHGKYHKELDGRMDQMVELSKAAATNKLASENLRKELVFFVMDDVINADLDFKEYLGTDTSPQE